MKMVFSGMCREQEKNQRIANRCHMIMFPILKTLDWERSCWPDLRCSNLKQEKNELWKFLNELCDQENYHPIPHQYILRVHSTVRPSKISQEGQQLKGLDNFSDESRTGLHYDAKKKVIQIRLNNNKPKNMD